MNTHSSAQMSVSAALQKLGVAITLAYLLVEGSEFSITGSLLYSAFLLVAFVLIVLILLGLLLVASMNSECEQVAESCGSSCRNSRSERSIALKTFVRGRLRDLASIGFYTVPACVFSYSTSSIVFCLMLAVLVPVVRLHYLLDSEIKEQIAKLNRKHTFLISLAALSVLIYSVALCGAAIVFSAHYGLLSVLAGLCIIAILLTLIAEVLSASTLKMRRETIYPWFADKDSSPIVGNNRSFIYHRRECPNVRKIKADRRVGFLSVEHAQWWRYRPSTGCPKKCH